MGGTVQDFTKDELSRLARRLTRAMVHGFTSLPPDFQESLRASWKAEMLWPLSLLIGGWYLSRESVVTRPAVLQLLAPYKLEPLLGQLTRFSDLLLPFARAAADSQTEYDMAGAGGAFAVAVQKIGLPLLLAVLGSDVFRDAADALRKGFAPQAAAEAQPAEPAAVARSAAAGSVASSADIAFWLQALKLPGVPESLRALYQEHIKQAETGAGTTSVALGEPMPQAADSPKNRDALPALTAEESCSTYLRYLGYPEHRIAELCAGPKQPAIAQEHAEEIAYLERALRRSDITSELRSHYERSLFAIKRQRG